MPTRHHHYPPLTSLQSIRVVFQRIWQEPAYVALHRAKDAIRPFDTEPHSEERRNRLQQFDTACAAINEYERKAGVK